MYLQILTAYPNIFPLNRLGELIINISTYTLYRYYKENVDVLNIHTLSQKGLRLKQILTSDKHYTYTRANRAVFYSYILALTQILQSGSSFSLAFEMCLI